MSMHLHFDLLGGIAGDMTVAALLDAGASFEALQQTLAGAELPLTSISAERTWKGGLAGTTFEVSPEEQPPSRHWKDIRGLLQQARLPETARRRALEIFALLADAEGQTHGCSPDEVHFHEVGAMDSIVDIVATAVCLELLDATSFSCGVVPLCEGRVTTEHGVLPLPAPATARLLSGFTVTPIPGTLETVTPTGAAILAALCEGSTGCPEMILQGTGVGLGTAELSDRPNVLRLLTGSLISSGTSWSQAEAVVLEANIDDMDPRLYGAVSAALFEAGALDVSLLPIQMKKGRPGTLLQVQCRPDLEGLLTGIVLRQTTTLGVRSHDVRRTELARRHETVSTPWGPVPVKLGLLGDTVINLAPEYDDCVELARTARVPVKDVLAAAAAAAQATYGPTLHQSVGEG